jgi:hypothetical protein
MQAPRKRRSVSWVGAGFVAAFAASVLTVIYTGLLVEAPRTRIAAGLPNVQMAVGRERTVNLVFTSRTTAAGVHMSLTMPQGIEVVGHEGETTIEWTTALAAGNNILPLTLIAAAPADGQIVARIDHADREEMFRIRVDAVVSGSTAAQ